MSFPLSFRPLVDLGPLKASRLRYDHTRALSCTVHTLPLTTNAKSSLHRIVARSYWRNGTQMLLSQTEWHPQVTPGPGATRTLRNTALPCYELPYKHPSELQYTTPPAFY